MSAYYNEIDRDKAAVLRELIRRNLIAPGDVDERSIKDVKPEDVRAYTQCHFFAGYGVWSYALRRAGWPDDREVWTGSCPCQGFSVAGKKKGFEDPRHLWPDWYPLIAERRPRVVFGEQSASSDALAWLDLVQSDLENADYACGAVIFPACGVGAPHIRQRLYFVADAAGSRRNDAGQHGSGPPLLATRFEQCGVAGQLADHASLGRERRGTGEAGTKSAEIERSERFCFTGEVANADGWDSCAERVGWAGPTNGFWGDVDWLRCTDGKWRPVDPGTFPLAHGAPARVGRLRGYGDAIVAEAAKEFIQAYMRVNPFGT